MMDFQRKADAAIVVSGEGFTARGWKFTALKEYLRDTYAASVVGEPKTQGDLSVVVRIGDGSKISGKCLVLPYMSLTVVTTIIGSVTTNTLFK
jgi:hypothetical protein